MWHQTWVDSDETLLLLEGRIRDEQMILEGQTGSAGVPVTKYRISWTPDKDGSIHQLWESTGTNGDWGVAFDGHCVQINSK